MLPPDPGPDGNPPSPTSPPSPPSPPSAPSYPYTQSIPQNPALTVAAAAAAAAGPLIPLKGATMQTDAPASDSSELHTARQPQPSPSQTTPPPASATIIAHSPSTGAHTRQSSSTSTPAISTRRAACTHTRLTRIYGPYKCHHCGRVPRLGWVYRCTQDFGDDLVGFQHRSEDSFTSALQRRLQQESEARSQLPQISEDVESRPSLDPPIQSTEAASAWSGPATHPPGSDLVSPELKPWMNRLIERGCCYSREQISVLRAQRTRVLECIAASAYPEPPEQAELQDVLIADPITMLPGPGSSHYARRYRRSAHHLPTRMRTSTIAPYWRRPNPPRQPLDGGPRGHSTPGRHSAVFGPHGSYTPSDQQLQQSELQQPSVCVYQTCSFCRSLMRDRTWQCLDRVVLEQSSSEPLQIPDPTTDNRPVSHPTLVQSACYKFHHPVPVPDLMSSSIFTSADLSDYDDDDDDDDFDLTTSGYDTSEISPDNSSEGTPTIPHFDEHRGWDTGPRWLATAPTPPVFPHRFGQPLAGPSAVTFGNPLSGYGPTYPGQRRILRRASSMDPRMLRSAREMAEMADIGLVGLGLNIAGVQESNEPVSQVSGQDHETQSRLESSDQDPDAREDRRQNTMPSAEDASTDGRYSRSGAISALDLRPSLDEQLSTSSSALAAIQRSEDGGEVQVEGGIAVTEEAVETGEPDVVIPAPEEFEGLPEDESNRPWQGEDVQLFG